MFESGSRSTTRTRREERANDVEKAEQMLDLPTPPFPEQTAIVRRSNTSLPSLARERDLHTTRPSGRRDTKLTLQSCGNNPALPQAWHDRDVGHTRNHSRHYTPTARKPRRRVAARMRICHVSNMANLQLCRTKVTRETRDAHVTGAWLQLTKHDMVTTRMMEQHAQRVQRWCPKRV